MALCPAAMAVFDGPNGDERAELYKVDPSANVSRISCNPPTSSEISVIDVSRISSRGELFLADQLAYQRCINPTGILRLPDPPHRLLRAHHILNRTVQSSVLSRSL